MGPGGVWVGVGGLAGREPSDATPRGPSAQVAFDASAAVADDRLVIGDLEGNLYCFASKDAPKKP